uniref:Rab-GAP TBC domain-containing protein n=1 Tax=Meloidogyne enterolobii TaxID=390850 RepID=A0A6V7WWZ2_MELEN|nr:unnamed protein product [Meloidogyne enterolobii]
MDIMNVFCENHKNYFQRMMLLLNKLIWIWLVLCQIINYLKTEQSPKAGALRNILYAFRFHNKSVEYCQGLNRIWCYRSFIS